MTPPGSHRGSGVKQRLTPKRRSRVVENDEYAAFVRRVIAAYSRRVADGDIEAITTMAHLADDLDTAIRQAITGLRAPRLLLGRHRRCGSASPAKAPSNAGAVNPMTAPGPNAPKTSSRSSSC